MKDKWIVINNWDTFQHYRDRSPIWIKNYTDLLRKDEYRRLSGHRRAVLHGLWLEYAMTGRRLLDNTSSLSQRLGLRVTSRDLKALNEAGFIRVTASKPLAKRYQVASPEIERELEKKPPKPPLRTNGTNQNGRGCRCAHDGLTFPSEKRLLEHLRNVHDDIPLPTPEAAA